MQKRVTQRLPNIGIVFPKFLAGYKRLTLAGQVRLPVYLIRHQLKHVRDL